MHIAAAVGHVEVVQALVQARADVNRAETSRTYYGTVRMFACSQVL